MIKKKNKKLIYIYIYTQEKQKQQLKSSKHTHAIQPIIFIHANNIWVNIKLKIKPNALTKLQLCGLVGSTCIMLLELADNFFRTWSPLRYYMYMSNSYRTVVYIQNNILRKNKHLYTLKMSNVCKSTSYKNIGNTCIRNLLFIISALSENYNPFNATVSLFPLLLRSHFRAIL